MKCPKCETEMKEVVDWMDDYLYCPNCFYEEEVRKNE